MKSVVYLPTDYEPSEDEPFMNEMQLEFFRKRLVAWRNEILADSRDTVKKMQLQARSIPDFTDRATEESERQVQLRKRDRQRKLVVKINLALSRIEEGEFGYCKATGRPISLKRLIARPIASYCLEAQERHERAEREFWDD
ncbi:MAG: RNA polymerase-binding protein DksA [Rhodobacteraceae bacterium]|nr:RNA polymerase-binding protein DksA [Paracoccaceae bacterium]